MFPSYPANQGGSQEHISLIIKNTSFSIILHSSSFKYKQYVIPWPCFYTVLFYSWPFCTYVISNESYYFQIFMPV